MADTLRASVAFAYGASDRSGEPEAGLLASGLRLERPPVILDWGGAAWNPPASFEDYLGRDRWTGEPGSDTEAALTAERVAYLARLSSMAAEASAGVPAAHEALAIEAPAIPAWVRRLAFRRVARDVASAYLTVSDAFHYIHRGEEIRAFVADALLTWAAESPRPRVAVGLSLGATILVDVLTELKLGGSLPVDLLVTVAGQTPPLYWCDALPVLRPVAADAATPFSPWLNIWNRDDLLSYPTVGAFEAPGIRDVVVTDTEAFPDNHGRYFANEQVFAAIRAAVGSLTQADRGA